MYVERPCARVVFHQLTLEFAYAEHRGLEYLLDIVTFLRVHHLVVTVLEFAIDVYVLDVETS